jgi:hypothetical protein
MRLSPSSYFFFSRPFDNFESSLLIHALLTLSSLGRLRSPQKALENPKIIIAR